MSAAPRCPYCFTDLDATEPEVRCSACGTPHHQACFLENGRCVVLGCTSHESKTLGGLVLRAHLDLEIGPRKSAFAPIAGFEHGEPRWLGYTSRGTEQARVFANKIEISLAHETVARGDKVMGEVALYLRERVLARGVRLVVRTWRTTPHTFVPTTLLEREAVLRGSAGEGHMRRLLGAVAYDAYKARKKIGEILRPLRWIPFLKRFLGDDPHDPKDLKPLEPGVTRWSFDFLLDPLHPIKNPDEPTVLVTTYLIAYVDLPGAEDITSEPPPLPLRVVQGVPRDTRTSLPLVNPMWNPVDPEILAGKGDKPLAVPEDSLAVPDDSLAVPDDSRAMPDDP